MKCHASPSQRNAAFSLIELALVLGVMAVAVIPILGSLMNAYQADQNSRERTGFTLVSQSCNAWLRSMSPETLRHLLEAGEIVRYFSEGGRMLDLGAAESGPAHYRCQVTLGSGIHSQRQISLRIVIAHPAPVWSKTVSYPYSVFHYGSAQP